MPYNDLTDIDARLDLLEISRVNLVDRLLALETRVAALAARVNTLELPPTAPDTRIWSAGMEAGNLNEWVGQSNGYDGCWASGGGVCGVTNAPAFVRRGQYAASMTTNNNGKTSSGARLMITQVGAQPPLPTDAYYSAWFRTPLVTVPSWLIIMQWKHHGPVPGSDPLYTVNIYNPAPGRMALRLYKYVGTNGAYNTTGQGYVASAPMDIPSDRWWHLECFYRWSKTAGRITGWQDGVQIFDFDNVRTQYDYLAPSDNRPFQWGVAAYADNTTPGIYSLYVDDATVSTARLGVL